MGLRRIRLMFFFVLLAVLFYVILDNLSLLHFSLVLQFWYIPLMVLLLAVVFIMLKATMLYIVGRQYGVQRTYWHFVKVFCASNFFELTTFTGKIGADGFKYRLWQHLPRKKRAALLVFLRSADICGFVWVFFFLLLPWSAALFVLFVSFFVVKQIRWKQKDWLRWIGVSVLATGAYLIMLTQISLVFSTIGLSIGKQVITAFATSHALGALSQLPFGLGVKDFTIFYQLSNLLTQEEIILGLVWARVFSELLSVLLGAIFISHQK